jgi:hypothetical protein
MNYKYINLRRFLGLVKGKLIKPTQNKLWKKLLAKII